VLLTNNIADASTGVQLYIGRSRAITSTGEPAAPGNHLNGTPSNGSTIPLAIRAQHRLQPQRQTDANQLFEDFGSEANVVIRNNLVAGGGYTIYGGQMPAARGRTDHRITQTGSHQVLPAVGLLRLHSPRSTRPRRETSASGNIWDSTGQPVDP